MWSLLFVDESRALLFTQADVFLDYTYTRRLNHTSETLSPNLHIPFQRIQ